MRSALAPALLLLASLGLAACLESGPAEGELGGEPGPGAGPATPVDPGPGLPGILETSEATRVSGGSEPVILADRAGRFLWIGDTSGVYASEDNGTTWTEVQGYTGDIGVLFGDGVALAQDQAGRLYGAFLHDNRADVARSDDGRRFAQAALAAGLPVDRPWIAAHEQTVSMVFLNNFGAIGLLEACVQSTDGGASFADRNPAAGPAGSGGIVADNTGTLYFTHSSSGAVTRIAGGCASSNWPLTDQKAFFDDGLGVNNQLQIATDGTALFVAAAGPGNAMQLAMARDWSDGVDRLTVSPEALATNTFGAVAARGDTVAVAWYGSTTVGDPSAAGFTGEFHVWVARVVDPFGRDGGPYTTLHRVTTEPNHRGQVCMAGVTCTGNRGLLDYFGVAIDVHGGIHVAYVDDTSGVETLHARIAPDGGVVTSPKPSQTATATNAPPSSTATSTKPAGNSTFTSGAGGSSGPTATFNATLMGRNVTVDASNATGRAPLSYRWTWGDGTSSTGIRAGHTYRSDGTFRLVLRVTDATGASDEAQAMVTADANRTAQQAIAPAAEGDSNGAPLPGLVLLAPLAAAVLRRRRT